MSSLCVRGQCGLRLILFHVVLCDVIIIVFVLLLWCHHYVCLCYCCDVIIMCVCVIVVLSYWVCQSVHPLAKICCRWLAALSKLHSSHPWQSAATAVNKHGACHCWFHNSAFYHNPKKTSDPLEVSLGLGLVCEGPMVFLHTLHYYIHTAQAQVIQLSITVTVTQVLT